MIRSLDPLVRLTQKHVANPLHRAMMDRGLPVPGVALLETTGRRSGEPRRTPIANGLDGDVFWVLAERGTNAQYVRNLQVNPHVRVKVGGRWRSGRAQGAAGEDPRRIARLMPAKVTATTARLLATDLTVIRIDLD